MIDEQLALPQRFKSSIYSEQNSPKRISTKASIESGCWEIHDYIVETKR